METGLDYGGEVHEVTTLDSVIGNFNSHRGKGGERMRADGTIDKITEFNDEYMDQMKKRLQAMGNDPMTRFLRAVAGMSGRNFDEITIEDSDLSRKSIIKQREDENRAVLIKEKVKKLQEDTEKKEKAHKEAQAKKARIAGNIQTARGWLERRRRDEHLENTSNEVRDLFIRVVALGSPAWIDGDAAADVEWYKVAETLVKLSRLRQNRQIDSKRNLLGAVPEMVLRESSIDDDTETKIAVFKEVTLFGKELFARLVTTFLHVPRSMLRDALITHDELTGFSGSGPLIDAERLASLRGAVDASYILKQRRLIADIVASARDSREYKRTRIFELLRNLYPQRTIDSQTVDTLIKFQESDPTAPGPSRMEVEEGTDERTGKLYRFINEDTLNRLYTDADAEKPWLNEEGVQLFDIGEQVKTLMSMRDARNRLSVKLKNFLTGYTEYKSTGSVDEFRLVLMNILTFGSTEVEFPGTGGRHLFEYTKDSQGTLNELAARTPSKDKTHATQRVSSLLRFMGRTMFVPDANIVTDTENRKRLFDLSEALASRSPNGILVAWISLLEGYVLRRSQTKLNDAVAEFNKSTMDLSKAVQENIEKAITVGDKYVNPGRWAENPLNSGFFRVEDTTSASLTDAVEKLSQMPPFSRVLREIEMRGGDYIRIGERIADNTEENRLTLLQESLIVGNRTYIVFAKVVASLVGLAQDVFPEKWKRASTMRSLQTRLREAVKRLRMCIARYPAEDRGKHIEFTPMNQRQKDTFLRDIKMKKSARMATQSICAGGGASSRYVMPTKRDHRYITVIPEY